VAWDDVCFVGEAKEPVVEGAEDLFAVAAGQVSAADGASEEGVSSEEEIFRREVEADAAFSMAGSVEDAGSVAGDADGGSVFEGGVGGKDFGRGDSDPGGLLVHDVKLGQVVLVEEDGSAGGFFETGGAADVVDVGVGDDDLLQSELMVREAGEDLRDVVTGVDDHGFARGGVAEDGAVALEGTDGEGFADHGYFYCRRWGIATRKGQARCPALSIFSEGTWFTCS
jgi:hypothetical protein